MRVLSVFGRLNVYHLTLEALTIFYSCGVMKAFQQCHVLCMHRGTTYLEEVEKEDSLIYSVSRTASIDKTTSDLSAQQGSLGSLQKARPAVTENFDEESNRHSEIIKKASQLELCVHKAEN